MLTLVLLQCTRMWMSVIRNFVCLWKLPDRVSSLWLEFRQTPHLLGSTVTFNRIHTLHRSINTNRPRVSKSRKLIRLEDELEWCISAAKESQVLSILSRRSCIASYKTNNCSCILLLGLVTCNSQASIV